MKKILAVILAALLLTGCAAPAKAPAADKLQIIATIFPEYDWVRQILGDTDSCDLTLLLDRGVDLHSFQPTADDIVRISNCDLFIYVGGESDEWVEDVLQEAKNADLVAVNLLDLLGERVKAEETIEGMQESEEEEHEHDEDEEELDEHVWLSLSNAAFICDHLAGQLAALDPANADAYQANTQSYIAKLDALDEQYRQAVAAGNHNTLLFADRFPFRYLVDDYGLSYYAAFVGCSAETEASFETVSFLARKVDELELPAVLTIEGGDQKIAQTVVSSTAGKNQPILCMNSLQSVTAKDVENGASYLSAMEQNLDALKQALQ